MNLFKSLTIASHLARCQKAINQLRDSKEIKEDLDWVLNLFELSSKNNDSGKISYLIVKEKKNDKNLESFLVKIFELSNKIKDQQSLSHEDWEFISDGLLMYRTNLLTKSSFITRYKCECD